MQPNWTSGYVSDVAHTLGFYRELAPAFLNYVCISNGVEGLPEGRTLRYCELGCGRGYGTTLLAAANPDIDFVGIDFNPRHIGEARDLAARAGVGNVVFLESTFGEAARSSDPALAGFDIVAMHAVYSWIAPQVREDIHEFFRARLVPGGLAYVSYNCMPGWAAAAPVQHLLKQYADRATGNSAVRIAGGRAALKALVDKSAAYFVQNPAVKLQTEAIQTLDSSIIAYEFLNEHWHPLYVTEALASLAEAKLNYVGSADVAENRLMLCVPRDLIGLVQQVPDLALRELLKDFAVNKQFRRDVYVKGPQRMAAPEMRRRFELLAFALTGNPRKLPEKWRVPSGEATVKGEALDAVVGRLQQGPATGAELLELGVKKQGTQNDVPAMLEIMMHNEFVSPCRPDFASVDRTASQRLNETVLELALAGDTHHYLAAPTLGSAVIAPHMERVVAQILREQPEADDATAAGLVFDRITATGRKLQREGKEMNRSKEDLGQIAKLVGEVREAALPRWRAFGALA